MKILYICHRYWPFTGGSETYFKEIAERCAKDGDEVIIYTTDAWDTAHFWFPHKQKIEIKEEVYNGVKIKRLKVQHLPAQKFIFKLLFSLPIKSFKYLFSTPCMFIPEIFFKLFEKKKFDIIHTMAIPYTPLLYLGVKYALNNKIPVVMTPFVHTGEPKNPEILKFFTDLHYIELMQKASKIIVQTDIESDVLVKKGILVEKIKKLGMAIDPNKRKIGIADRFRKKYNIFNKIVFQVSTLIYDKGTYHALEAMKILWDKGYDATLVLIGNVEQLFDEYFSNQPPYIYKNCVVLDLTSSDCQNDLMDLFAAGDVFVMPSRADSFGIVFLEAWLYKKPVIGAYAGGVPEVIEEGKDGFLVPFGDVHMLSEYIATLLENESLRHKFGEYGYNKTITYHTWDKRYEIIKEVYKSLIKQ